MPKKVSALLTQLSRINHLLIMSVSKSGREFYIRLAIKAGGLLLAYPASMN